MGRRVYRNYYNGNTDKTKGEGGNKGGRWVLLGGGEEKIQTTVIEQQKNNFKKQ